MKLGLSIKIDVSKIDKSRLYQGAKGTYLDLTTFISDELDQYENNGFISQSVTAEEREAKTQTPILGNVKIFYTDSAEAAQSAPQAAAIDEDIPF